MNNSVTTKGIILAGGAGTRLHPITRVVSKQLLPIYNKPMIYYPLSTLINSGIDEIMVITTPEDEHLFKRLLGNGNQWNVSIDYAIQEKPNGIAQALLICDEWLNGSNSVLILGDNLFFGPNINKIIKDAIISNKGATIFGYQVDDPNRFGVIEFDENNNVLSVEEKPKIAKSKWAATGLYIYDNQASKKTENLKFSDRGELEITELNNSYLVENKLKVILLDDSFSWLDTGTHDTLLEASNFVRKIKNKFGEDSIGLI
tara:strand:+ start:534 stop:1310 length:777 start_codon:yes stop_codon:yes gene_type:complete